MNRLVNLDLDTCIEAEHNTSISDENPMVLPHEEGFVKKGRVGPIYHARKTTSERRHNKGKVHYEHGGSVAIKYTEFVGSFNIWIAKVDGRYRDAEDNMVSINVNLGESREDSTVQAPYCSCYDTSTKSKGHQRLCKRHRFYRFCHCVDIHPKLLCKCPQRF